MTHIPKGSMCLVCNNRTSKTCGSLDFAAMKPLKKYPDGTVAVKCSSFDKERQYVIESYINAVQSVIESEVEDSIQYAKDRAKAEAALIKSWLEWNTMLMGKMSFGLDFQQYKNMEINDGRYEEARDD